MILWVKGKRGAGAPSQSLRSTSCCVGLWLLAYITYDSMSLIALYSASNFHSWSGSMSFKRVHWELWFLFLNSCRTPGHLGHLILSLLADDVAPPISCNIRGNNHRCWHHSVLEVQASGRHVCSCSIASCKVNTGGSTCELCLTQSLHRSHAQQPKASRQVVKW